jgi:hypothetical protein
MGNSVNETRLGSVWTRPVTPVLATFLAIGGAGIAAAYLQKDRLLDGVGAGEGKSALSEHNRSQVADLSDVAPSFGNPNVNRDDASSRIVTVKPTSSIEESTDKSSIHFIVHPRSASSSIHLYKPIEIRFAQRLQQVPNTVSVSVGAQKAVDQVGSATDSPQLAQLSKSPPVSFMRVQPEAQSDQVVRPLAQAVPQAIDQSQSRPSQKAYVSPSERDDTSQAFTNTKFTALPDDYLAEIRPIGDGRVTEDSPSEPVAVESDVGAPLPRVAEAQNSTRKHLHRGHAVARSSANPNPMVTSATGHSASRQRMVEASASSQSVNSYHLASDAVQFQTAVRSNGSVLGKVTLQTKSNGEVSLKLAEFVSLFSKQLDPALLKSMENSRSADSFVTFDRIRSAGIEIHYDAANNQIAFSASEE